MNPSHTRTLRTLGEGGGLFFSVVRYHCHALHAEETARFAAAGLEPHGDGSETGVVHDIASEKDTKLAQKLGQLQPSTCIAVFRQECVGQLAYFGLTGHLSRCRALLRPGGRVRV